MTLDPQTRAAILDRGRHLHDMAVANGMDRGRYALRPVDGEMRIFPGPNFTALEPEDWVERTIDEHLVSGESA